MTFTTFEAQSLTPTPQKENRKKREILTSSSELTHRFPEYKGKHRAGGEFLSCYRILVLSLITQQLDISCINGVLWFNIGCTDFLRLSRTGQGLIAFTIRAISHFHVDVYQEVLFLCSICMLSLCSVKRNQTDNVRINVILRRVSATIDAIDEQYLLHVLSECL